MIVRKLNPDTGDIETSGTQFIYNTDAMAQTIKTRLNLFLGEYYRDIDQGVDWYGSVFLKNSSSRIGDAEIRRIISEFEGVQAITDYSSNFDIKSRQVSIKATVMTDQGEVSVDFEEQLNGTN